MLQQRSGRYFESKNERLPCAVSLWLPESGL